MNKTLLTSNKVDICGAVVVVAMGTRITIATGHPDSFITCMLM